MEADQQQQDQNVNAVLEDLIFDVLTRLPVKSLTRFRSVSKGWSFLISSSSFVDAHFSCSSSRPSFFVSLPVQSKKECQFFLSPLPQQNSRESRTLAVPFEFLPDCCVFWPMTKSLNGLICFDTGTSIRIYNPSNREYITLIHPKPDFQQSHASIAHTYYSTNYFLFDPVEKIHKVLSRWKFLYGYPFDQLLVTENWIFTLGENSWRRIEDGPIHYSVSDALCIDGTLYYRAYHIGAIAGESFECFLIAFDVRLEKFRVLSKDLYLPLFYQDSVTMIDFGGRLGAVNYQLLKSHGCMELWVLEDPIQLTCSTRKIVLPAYWGDLVGKREVYVAGTLDGGEIILAQRPQPTPFCVFVYDIKKNSVRKVEIELQPPPEFKCNLQRYFITFSAHVESIVSFANLSF